MIQNIAVCEYRGFKGISGFVIELVSPVFRYYRSVIYTVPPDSFQRSFLILKLADLAIAPVLPR